MFVLFKMKKTHNIVDFFYFFENNFHFQKPISTESKRFNLYCWENNDTFDHWPKGLHGKTQVVMMSYS